MTVALDVILLLAALLPLVWKRAEHSLELFLFLLVVAAGAVAGAALLSRIISGGTHPRQYANLIAAARLSITSRGWAFRSPRRCFLACFLLFFVR